MGDGGARTHYAYDRQGNVLVELDAAGVVQAVYALEPDSLDRPVAQVRAGARYYYHQDHLGSVWAITDAAQAQVRGYTYGPTGVFGSTTGTLPNAYHYTGREWDDALGLYYYRARHMDARQGRFLQRDPLGDVGGVNLYAYARSNTATFVDPSGTVPLNANERCHETVDNHYAKGLVECAEHYFKGVPPSLFKYAKCIFCERCVWLTKTTWCDWKYPPNGCNPTGDPPDPSYVCRKLCAL